MQKISRRALERFSSQKFHFEIFPKTNAISITFGPRYIHGQSLEVIDFPTQTQSTAFRETLKNSLKLGLHIPGKFSLKKKGRKNNRVDKWLEQDVFFLSYGYLISLDYACEWYF